jgi:hypothetical protein
MYNPRRSGTPGFIYGRNFGPGVEIARHALGGLGGLGGVQSAFDFAPFWATENRLGEQIFDALSQRDWLDKAFGQHKPGDVVLSDEERNNMSRDAFAPARDAYFETIRARKAKDAAFSESLRNSGYYDTFRDIEKGQAYDLGPLNRRMGDPNLGQGHMTDKVPMAGNVLVPDHLRPWLEAGMQQQGLPDPTTVQHRVHPNGLTASEMRDFTVDPTYWYGEPIGGENSFMGVDYKNLQRNAAMDTISLLGQGRAAMDPSFDWAGLNQSVLDYQKTNETGFKDDRMRNMWASLQADFGQGMEQRKQAATLNQQAYDVMMNKGQQGGTIPSDFARPFYGQITGIEGFGGQGTPWSPNQPLANAPGFGFGQTQGQGGFGWGGGQAGGQFGAGWAAGGQQQNTRSDTPASGWGGVFNQRNPWSLS